MDHKNSKNEHNPQAMHDGIHFFTNAEMKLRSTSKSVTQIAMECGYNNIAYFSAMYKSIKSLKEFHRRLPEIPEFQII